MTCHYSNTVALEQHVRQVGHAKEASASARATFADALRGEVSKLSSLRSPLVAAVLTVVLVWALAAVITLAAQRAALDGNADQLPGLVPASAFLYPLFYGQFGIVLFASWLFVEEEGAGNLRTTFLATPRRSAVFWSKALVAMAGGLLIAALAVLGAYVIRTAMVGNLSIGDASIPDGRILAGYLAYWTLLAGIVCGAAALLRSGVAALVSMMSLILVVSPFMLAYKVPFARFLPDQAGAQMSLAAVPHGSDLGPWLGLLVVGAWLCLALAAGAASLRTRRL